MVFSLDQIYNDFPIFNRKVNGKKLVYLDSAATSQKPRQVIKAISDYYSVYNANVHRGIHKLAAESTELFEDSRRKIAKFINASSDEIIFVRNATEGINLVRYAYCIHNLTKNDVIINSIMEHHSNHVPWLTLSHEIGATLKTIDINSSFEVSEDIIKDALENDDNNKYVKLVALTHCSNVLGTITSPKKLSKIAHSKGALFLLDACQSVPHMPVDVRSLDCDFMVFSGHKMLGPTGIGILYVKKKILESMQPFLFGGDMIKEVHKYNVKFNDIPYKFEAGTPDIAGVIGLAAAVDYLSKIGMRKILRHEQNLIKYAIDQFQSLKIGTYYGPENVNHRTGILSFTIPNVHSHDIAQILNDDGIAIRSGYHCAQPLHDFLGISSTARASFYLYNNYDDIDKFIAGLKKVIKIFH